MLKHQIGRFEEAHTLYKKSIANHPNHATIVASFANLIKVWKKDYVRSKQLFEKAISISSEDTELLGNYAVLLHGHLKEYDSAEKAYRRSIEAPGGTSIIYKSKVIDSTILNIQVRTMQTHSVITLSFFVM